MRRLRKSGGHREWFLLGLRMVCWSKKIVDGSGHDSTSRKHTTIRDNRRQTDKRGRERERETEERRGEREKEERVERENFVGTIKK